MGCSYDAWYSLRSARVTLALEHDVDSAEFFEWITKCHSRRSGDDRQTGRGEQGRSPGIFEA